MELCKLSKVKVTDHELGHGSYATVLEVKYKGRKCAGKKIHELLLKQGNETYTLRHFEEECRLMSQIHHSNIVEFLGVYFQKGSNVPILVMEFLPVSLTYCIEKVERNLPNEIKYSILDDIARGLFHLHSQNPPIIHRDLSSNNILITTDMRAKIADLGVARILDLSPLQVSHMTQTPGTPAYMPPEVMVDKPNYDTSIDIFSYGVLMIHVFCGEWPTPKTGQIHTVGDRLIPITEAERRGVYLNAVGHSHPLMELILRCINNNPQLRPPTQEIVEVLNKTVLRYPLTQPGKLVPVTKTNERDKHVINYDYIEYEDVTKFVEKGDRNWRAREKEARKATLLWARKRANSFFVRELKVGLFLIHI